MVNRTLRLMDVDVIIKIGFFISDLHCHINQLHLKQFGGHHSGDSFTVYRGQGMAKTEFEEMTKTEGGLISFNSFYPPVRSVTFLSVSPVVLRRIPI